jgi:hypothetical protein
VAQFRKSCINKINNQCCPRKALCTKSDVRKADHAALLRELAFSGHKLSQEDRAARIRRFAELSVCSACDAEVGEISKVTDEQMQAFIEILFPDGVEQMDEMDDDDDMGTLGEDDNGQQDGGDEHGDDQPVKDEQDAWTGIHTATQLQATPRPGATTMQTPPPSSGQSSVRCTGQPFGTMRADPAAPAARLPTPTPPKLPQPTASGAQEDAATQDQATNGTNRKSAKPMVLLKALLLAAVVWGLISHWMLFPVVFDEILCSWFNSC